MADAPKTDVGILPFPAPARPPVTYNDKYNTTQLQYPNDLFSNKGVYGGNYVVFYINVAIDSKISKLVGENYIKDNIPPRVRGEIAGSDLSKIKATVVGAAILGGAGGLTGALSGKDLLSKTNKDGVSSKNSIVRDIGKGALVGGGSAIAIMNQAASMNRQQKRLNVAIAMHVPNTLSITYGVQWQDEGTLAFQAGDAILTTSALSATTAVLANQALTKTPIIAAALSAGSGLAANPKKEQIFKGVDRRSFVFKYLFSPRNAEESSNVRNIIKTFKYHMHPEYKDENNFLYIYPSEFDITYFQSDKENLNLHRHTSCVLTNMTVNYTPGGGTFATFPDGSPTQIEVTLSFTELAMLTKELIQESY